MRAYRLLPQAILDLETGISFYDTEYPGLGVEFAIEVRQLCRLIAQTPASGFKFRSGVRRRILRRFPYSILYTVDRTEVLIVAIAHQSRRPGYWSRRVQDGGISGEYRIKDFSGESNAVRGNLSRVSGVSPD